MISQGFLPQAGVDDFWRVWAKCGPLFQAVPPPGDPTGGSSWYQCMREFEQTWDMPWETGRQQSIDREQQARGAMSVSTWAAIIGVGIALLSFVRR